MPNTDPFDTAWRMNEPIHKIPSLEERAAAYVRSRLEECDDVLAMLGLA